MEQPIANQNGAMVSSPAVCVRERERSDGWEGRVI